MDSTFCLKRFNAPSITIFKVLVPRYTRYRVYTDLSLTSTNSPNTSIAGEEVRKAPFVVKAKIR